MGVLVVAAPAWGSPAVDELVREARAHEAAHEDAVAARRYTEALALDPTCEDAYLGLGALRARLGDAREAERVYSFALEHAPADKRALVGRARARRALGERLEAEQDLEAYVGAAPDLDALRELAAWYGEDGGHAAELSAWRKILGYADRTGDAPLAREARTMVRALQLLIGPADPVASPPSPASAIRRALSSVARRTG